MVIKLFTALLLIGIYLIFSDNIIYLIKDFLFRFRKINSAANKSRLKKHFEKIFIVISKDNKEKRDEQIFYALTIIVFIFSFYALTKLLYITGSLVSLAFTIMPYVYIRAKLVLKQRTGSFEGEAFLREIFTQYKRCNRYIITTIDETVKNLSDEEPVTKRALFRVSLRIKSTKSDAELKEILNDFVYALNTNWSRLLADNLFSAISEKIDVYPGLKDLYESCKKINKNLEANKRENLESAGIIKLLAPGFIIMFTYLGASIMDMQKMMEYQFGTTTGVMMFCLIVISIVLGFIFINLMTKPKYE
ncbi:MAG: hypothetical protein PHQ49_07300 [Clostridia bacterium]|nr:hypothetical protein [Clostridia bacterium]